uniref:Mitochondrial ribosomal protein S14 n=1 Tax=Romanomermis culicivorax TaxID=13658 RepID=A0A915L109_ROMCU
MIGKIVSRFFCSTNFLRQAQVVAADGRSKAIRTKSKYPRPNRLTMEESSFEEYNKGPMEMRRNWDEPYYFHCWPNWKTNTDFKRRKVVAEYAPQRLRLLAMVRAAQLPKVFREQVREDLNALPKDSRWYQVENLCMFTGRKRGKVVRMRLSRFCFRKRADHGKLGGVMRAVW